MTRCSIAGCALALLSLASSAVAWDDIYLPSPVPGAQKGVVRYHRGPFGGVHYKNKYHMGHHGGVVTDGGGLFNGNFWTHAGNAVTLAGTVMDLINRDDQGSEDTASREARDAQFRSAMDSESQKLADAQATVDRLDRLAVAFGVQPSQGPQDNEAPGTGWGNYPPGNVGPGTGNSAQNPGNNNPSSGWGNFPPGNVNPGSSHQAQGSGGSGSGSGWKNYPPGNK